MKPVIVTARHRKLVLVGLVAASGAILSNHILEPRLRRALRVKK